jgi:archaetidylinositol phosphate synthase
MHMVSNKLRFISNRVIEPIAKRFAGSRVTPNQVTILGLIVMIGASAATAVVGMFKLDPVWLIVTLLLLILSGFFDLLDGGIAKFTGRKSKFGGVLDSCCDRYADGFFILGLVFGNFLAPPAYLSHYLPDPATWDVILGFLGLLGAYMTSYVRSRAEIESVNMAGVGWIERGERLMALTLALVLHILLPTIGMIFYVFLVLTVLMHVTAIQRIVHAKNELKMVDEKTKIENN